MVRDIPWVLVLGALVNNGMVLLADSAADNFRLLNLSDMSFAVQAVAGILTLTLLDMVKHRLQHASGLLWRFHQLHHSSERLDVGTSFYFHPIDIIMTAAIAMLVGGVILGLDSIAAQVTGFYLFFASILTHANIRTPKWLGYFIPRPEAHAVHHERDLHWYNFASLPLWDILAGTFRNPASWNEQPGLVDGATSHLGSMMLGRRIDEPRRQVAASPAVGSRSRHS